MPTTITFRDNNYWKCVVASTVAPKNRSLVFIFNLCPHYLHQSDTLCDIVLAFPSLMQRDWLLDSIKKRSMYGNA